jgi:2-dehydro-3-deoxyphosphogalactonate aldolase
MAREIIAILRGISPPEAVSVASTLVNAGIVRIEVTLNSPSALESIKLMTDALSDRAEFGAGTVVNRTQVEAVKKTGATFVVSPNTNTDVIRATKLAGMDSYPGVLTPSECFSALESGADALKLFPAFHVGPNGLRAILAVLPVGVKIYAVGGVGPEQFSDWHIAGVTGFGIGNLLYTPGLGLEKVSSNAKDIVQAYDSLNSD